MHPSRRAAERGPSGPKLHRVNGIDQKPDAPADAVARDVMSGDANQTHAVRAGRVALQNQGCILRMDGSTPGCVVGAFPAPYLTRGTTELRPDGTEHHSISGGHRDANATVGAVAQDELRADARHAPAPGADGITSKHQRSLIQGVIAGKTCGALVNHRSLSVTYKLTSVVRVWRHTLFA
jgi:hypothetical protein